MNYITVFELYNQDYIKLLHLLNLIPFNALDKSYKAMILSVRGKTW